MKKIKEIKIADIAGRVAKQKAEFIDSQILPFIPNWQLKLIKNEKFRLTHILFGYTLDIDHSLNLDTYTFKRYGKTLTKFGIKILFKTNETN